MTYRVSRRTGACAAGVVSLFLALLSAGCSDPTGSPLAPDKVTPQPAPHVPLPPVGQVDWVPNQLVVQVEAKWTIEEVHAICHTYTLAAMPDERTYLVGTPSGIGLYQLAHYMVQFGYCAFAEPNYLLESPESEQKSWAIYEGGFDHGDYVDQDALERIGAVAAHQIATGAGVLVAVVDTGIDLDHPDLAQHISSAGYDFIDNSSTPDDLPNGVDDNRNGDIDEATGHGTHVAGIVAAVAPEAQILPLRVLNSDGTGTAYNVAQAIYKAHKAGAQVINLSLGMDEGSLVIEHAIEVAYDGGAVIVASAGNRGIRDEQHFPARLSEVIAVAAVDANDRKADFSNYGSHISVSAPGVGIMSTYWNGGYALWSGTSMSVPFVVGAAALRIQMNPGTPDEIQQLIEETSAHFPGDSSPDAYAGLIGEGRVDLYSLVVAKRSAYQTTLAR
jgi:subtilisin family serine protease